jgi:hypothetical protein
MAEQEPSKLKTGVRFSSPASERVYERFQGLRSRWYPFRDSYPTAEAAFEGLKTCLRETDLDGLRHALGGHALTLSTTTWGRDGLAEPIRSRYWEGALQQLRELAGEPETGFECASDPACPWRRAHTG